MRAHLTRQKAATSAILAASIAVLAACGGQAGTQADPQATATAEPSPAPQSTAKAVRTHYARGTILISDGTNVVTVGDTKVTFPTTVTDAVWSPDGSRIAFIDGDGRVATARPDGTSLVLVKSERTAERNERPAWYQSSILYTRHKGATSHIIRANAAGTAPEGQPESDFEVNPASNEPLGSVGLPSAAVIPDSYDDGDLAGFIAYERETAKGDEVWVLDYNQREPVSTKIADGSEPAISPDGKKVAFVGRDGQIAVAPVPGDTHKATKVTFGAATPSHLVWTPDGARIAYSTPHGIQSVAAIPVGAKSNPAKQISARPGVLSYLAGQTNRVEQIGGDPVAAAIRASQARWISIYKNYDPKKNPGPASSVILAPASQPDIALAASEFAVSTYGPLLLTSGTSLDPAVVDELKRLFGKVDPGGAPEVTLVGDYPLAVLTAIRNLGFNPKHITGTPSALSAAAATQLGGQAMYAQEVLVIDTADRQKAALAIADFRGPVIFSENGKLAPSALAYVHGATSASVRTIGSQAASAVPHIPQVKVGPAGDWSGDSVSFAQHYLGCPRVAVVVDGDSNAAFLAIAVSAAIGTRAPLLMVGDSPAGYLDTMSGTTERAYVVGSAPAGFVDLLASAIS